jgi:hypothetical protein
MKTAILFATIFLFTLAHAQDGGTSKLILGGTLRFNNNSSSFKDPTTNADIESSYRLANLNPYFGYWLDSSWMVGLQVNIIHAKRSQYVQSVNDKVVNKQRQYGIGLFVRRYFREYNGLRVFLETGASYATGTNKSSNPQVTFGSNGGNKEALAYLAPGINWAVSKRINLLARLGSLSYVSGRRKPLFNTNDVTYHYFSAQMNGQTFYLGAELRF